MREKDKLVELTLFHYSEYLGKFCQNYNKSIVSLPIKFGISNLIKILMKDSLQSQIVEKGNIMIEAKKIRRTSKLLVLPFSF
jgi:hypothetical protein